MLTPLAKRALWFKLADMRHTLTKPPSTLVEVDSGPPFNVLIAYEDFETGKHAKRTYDYLAENLGRECQLTNQMWKFDALSIPKLREIAVRDATMADIIFISSHGDKLPECVSMWIESWAMQGTEALALVALFDQPGSPAGVAELKSYLSGVAKRAGLEFFAQPDEWPCSDLDGLPFMIQRGTSTSAPKFAGLHQENSTSRWGINE